jgi:hypothetical protein
MLSSDRFPLRTRASAEAERASPGAAPFFYLCVLLVAAAVLTIRSVRRRRAI